jgi:aspartate 4-decarboxylase
MKPTEEKRYEGLSPFELKNKLIKIAKTHHERVMLNAGRGNPNWVATTPRSGFFELGIFAVQESLRVVDRPSVGGAPQKQGIARRFELFLEKKKGVSGIEFLQNAYAYVCDELKIDPDEFIIEMVDAILGDHYPEPDRMLTNCERIVHKYIEQEMCAGNPPAGKFDLFATEGGTAAMDYIFSSLMENKLLHKGDTIALGTPIFTPYIEIPRLNDYEFVELMIEQDENQYWQYPDSEIEKLADPKVKAFFLVHPSNPTSVAMQPQTLEKIAQLIRTKRKDLILLTDDVYGTFVNGFRSLAAVIPENTILVYSYSKYFGATGWRLGVIGIHHDNVFDKKIAALPAKDRKELHERYSTVILDPDKMKLIDRMVADSRSVALHHTAGLSTPQQVLMTLFSLYCLIDKKQEYKKEAQYIVAHRFKTLYDNIGIPAPENQYDAHYYTTIDVPKLAEERYGKEFKDYLVKKHEPIDFVVKLSERKSVILMDGGGFDAPNMSIRVSLANLPNNTYEDIGKGINELLAEYHRHWESQKLKNK